MRNALFVWACTPSELPFPAERSGDRAHLGYRISDRGRLFYGFARRPTGGILILSDDGSGRPEAGFEAELERELRRGRFSGLYLDFEAVTPALFSLTKALDELAKRMRLRLYVPEPYAVCAQDAFVLIGSDVCAGDFVLRMEEAALRFGDRLALELIPLRADFRLPGQGRAVQLAPQQLAALQKDAQVYFSSSLLANYFTYRDEKKDTHFVLYDDGASLSRKCAAAERAGAKEIFALYGELAPFALDTDNPDVSDAY